jgi:hypothetical protein
MIATLIFSTPSFAAQPMPSNSATTLQKIQRNVAQHRWGYCKNLTTDPDPRVKTEIFASELASLWREHDITEAENKPAEYAQQLVDQWRSADELRKKIIEDRIQIFMGTINYEKRGHFQSIFYTTILDEKQGSSSLTSSSSSSHP